jgi:hypothetical protein
MAQPHYSSEEDDGAAVGAHIKDLRGAQDSQVDHLTVPKRDVLVLKLLERNGFGKSRPDGASVRLHEK